MNKVITKGYIIDKMMKSHRFSKINNKNLVHSVIKDYFNMVQENVLNGYEFDFGKSKDASYSLGSLCIHKRRHTPSKLPVYSKVTRDTAYNKHTIGYYFTIDLDSDVLKREEMKFKASSSFRKKLSGLLFKGETNYRLIN